jgi:hypothetical protein
MEAVEAELATTLVGMVGGTRPSVSPAEVQAHLAAHFHVAVHEVHVHYSQPDDFLLLFSDISMAYRVLHAPSPIGRELTLRFHRWCLQSRTIFSPLRYKVLLAIENFSAHAWSPEAVVTPRVTKTLTNVAKP